MYITKVKLTDLLDVLQFQFDESEAWINMTTGEIYVIQDEMLRIVEDGKTDYPDWMETELQKVKDYLKVPDNFIAIPAKDEIDEYHMMEQFALKLDEKNKKEKLLIALQGKGAFRRFKDTVIFLGIEEQWYKFRDERYKKFALEWCQSQEMEVIE